MESNQSNIEERRFHLGQSQALLIPTLLFVKDPDNKAAIVPRHFYSLDALRGVAALAVVFWHWQHFFFHGTELGPFDPSQQPLYSLFKPLYTDGIRAVDLFFCLSGFIFFWLYAERIQRRETSLKQFFVLRFSRLYPLHFLALIAVAAGQQLMLWRNGTFFVYPHNDLYHFVLQTLFASNWGFERGFSFNGPTWSVSVEILLYGLFFFTCLLNLRRWWHLALLMCSGYVMIRFGRPCIGRGVFWFFVGGVSFQAFSHISKRSPTRLALQCLGVFTGLMWIIIPVNSHRHLTYEFYRNHLWADSLSLHGKDVFGSAILLMERFSFELLLFPLAIVTLALWEVERGTLGRRLAFLGHISYSSYLLHFPLQMMFAGVALSFAIPPTFFYTPLALFLFFGTLIPLSLCSYHFIERPCQSLIRAWAFRSPRSPREEPNLALQRTDSVVTAPDSTPRPSPGPSIEGRANSAGC